MTEYSATSYAVGGLYTHGGDIEWETDVPPAGLTRVWDSTDAEWRHAIDEHGSYWMPIGTDGQPLPDGQESDWIDLLRQFGPVSDVEPAAVAVTTRRPLSDADRADIAEDQHHVRLADGNEDHL